jgi:hypothetical protein
LGVGVADAMRQTTMTQCYKSPPSSAVGRMPGGAVAPPKKPPPTTFPPVSAPPGYHYYEMHGIAYFLNLATGEKVNLGPVESPSSLVTPSGKMERMATVKMENGMATAVKMESIAVEIETAKRKVAGNDDVVDLSQNRPKKTSRPVADEDVEVVHILDDDDEDLEDLLPNTCDFTPPAATKKKDGRSDESSDGGETILVGSEEQDLLLSSDS